MRGGRFLLAAGLAVPIAAAACSLFVDLGGLSGTPDGADAAADGPSAAAYDAGSCRALHAQLGALDSGAYALRAADGGTFDAYCDMVSFDGGWTLVTPAMIVDDKTSQDYAPTAPGRIAVVRDTDARGGRAFRVSVSVGNCATNNKLPGPSHYFLVGELDAWTQIMATYTFTGSADCWHIFGNAPADVPDMNVVAFDLTRDLIDRQQNMSRTTAGASVPYDGRTVYCDTGKDNYWAAAYVASPRTARVVQRRFAPVKPTGLSVSADCATNPAWDITDVFVR